ncbi:MAG: FkbM family methyltransferase [Planctomycetes bacterium]|nr:FkbM family methyltransferase [Planctomycetota bacterium]
MFKQDSKYVQDNWDTLRKRGPAHLAETWFKRSELADTRELKCRRLDDILREEFPDTPFHFLKIDAQGAEYNILKGATTLLSNSCIGLHLELFMIPLLEGIAMFDEVESFLKDYGFKLIKKFPPHGSFESQHDCLFLNEGRDHRLDSLIRSVYNINAKA